MQQQPSSIEEQRKTALSDLASLGRVSHRVALVDTTAKLQTVLDKLLPRLLQRIGDNHQHQVQAIDASLKETLTKIHLKLVEMLSHIMKRVREDRSCRLNANGILSLLLTEKERTSLQSPVVETTGGTRNNTDDVSTTTKLAANVCDAFTLNLSLAFLTLAIPRCTSIELEMILPGLLVLHASCEKKVEHYSSNESSAEITTRSSIIQQWHQISHLLLRSLERIMHQEEIDNKQSRNGSKTDNTSNKRIKTDQKEKNEKASSTHPTTPLGLDQARHVLEQNPVIAGATYDLFLDVLLYETQAGNVPPAGLSSMGWDRLKSGSSSTERDWAAEMAPLSRLATFKIRLLEWIRPHRRWGLFMASRNEDYVAADDPHEKNTQTRMGISRTLALLVVASGDTIQSVSENAKQCLKQYFDSQRINGDKIFGVADRLCKELLSLSVGGIKAETVLGGTALGMENSAMGLIHSNVSFRRRQVSDSCFCEMVETVTNVFEDTTDSNMLDIGKLSILACDKTLSDFGIATGLNNQRGRRFVVAAEHLKCLVIRLDKCKEQYQATLNLQGRALIVATHVLSPIAATKVTSSSNAMSESSIAVRDSIYGVISVLSRSCFAEKNFLCVMAAGRMEAATLSIDLLQLLFRCVANEADKLQPSAVAALDALLFACCRAARNESGNTKISLADTNPWIASSLEQPALTTALASQLARLIVPLLWMASQNSQSRQSRAAAARWASDLLVDLDLVSATHILCFLSGDSDVTAASIAREGLGFGRNGEGIIAGYKELCIVLFPDLASHSRPGFWDFTVKGKTTTVKCLLASFLGDFHLVEADATLMLDSLSKLLSEEGSSRDMDLMDICSEALSTCLGASSTIRNLVRTSATGLGPENLRDLILSAGSATTRRFLSEALKTLMVDISNFDSLQWKKLVAESILMAYDVLKVQPLKSTAQVHGAALLGGLCIKLIHSDVNKNWGDSIATAAQVMVCLSSGLLSPDDSVGNFCCDGIVFLCSVDGATTLHAR
jgi:proteasome component ECM29